MSDTGGGPPQPPAAPDIERRVRLHRFQWVGMPFLIAVPLLALLGLFGETWSTAGARSSGLELSLRYPTRFRYKMLNRIDVTVVNTSGRMLDTVFVEFDPDYVESFSAVTFTPSEEEAYRVPLTDVRPDERRSVVAEIQGERYWGHAGWIRAWARGTDTASVDIGTIVYP